MQKAILLKAQTTMVPNNQITVLGQVRSSEAYGSDYLSELRRILTQFVKPVTRLYLEWGSGNTTLAIVEWRNALPLDAFYSIDNDGAYLDDLVKQIPAWHGFHPICADLMGPKASDRDPDFNYSTLPLSFASQFDFILIDGRRRLECAFVASLISHPDTVIALHDYWRRRYQPVKALFEILEDGSQFRVMRPRRGFSVDEGAAPYNWEHS
jgi:hypothetical protein